MGKKKITQIVEEELRPFLETEGYTVYHSEFVKESRDWFLRVYIERMPAEPGIEPDPVSADDCEKVSRYLSSRLDETDPIEQNYYLEVSSPGMDRVLHKKDDYLRYCGKLVDIRLYQAIQGKKQLTAKLMKYEDHQITVETESGGILEIPSEALSKVQLTVVF